MYVDEEGNCNEESKWTSEQTVFDKWWLVGEEC